MHVLTRAHIMDTLDLTGPDNLVRAVVAYLNHNFCHKTQGVARRETLGKVVAFTVHAQILLFIRQFHGQVRGNRIGTHGRV